MPALLLERFLQTSTRAILDLATARPAWWYVHRLPPSGGASWDAQCRWLLETSRARGLQLLDYGALRDDRCFEAWAVDKRGGPPLVRQRAIALNDARRAVLADGSPGRGDGCTPPSAAPARPLCALNAVALAELLDSGSGAGLRFVDLPHLVPALAVRRRIWLARFVRLRGYVPVCLEALAQWPMLFRLFRRVHVAVLCRGGWGAPAAAELLTRLAIATGTSGARSHLLFRDFHHPEFGPTLGANHPSTNTHHNPLALLHETAADARSPDQRADGHATGVPRHERWNPHGAIAADGPGQPAGMARVEQRLRQARHSASRGRHAAALREFLDGIAASVRRSAWPAAAHASVERGWLLRRRGQTAASLLSFQQAAQWSARAGDAQAALDALTGLGHARVDDGALAEGESAFRSVLFGAREAGDRVREAVAWAGVARVCGWQARFEELDAVRVRIGSDVPQAAVEGLRQTVRAALVRGDFPTAMAAAREAADAAGAAADSMLVLKAVLTMAEVRAGVGDVKGLEAAVADGLSRARHQHAPLAAVRLRLTLAEGFALAGDSRAAARVVRRLGDRVRVSLPALLRARADLIVHRVLAGGLAVPRSVEAFVRRSGARTLLARRAEAAQMDFVHDLIALLQTCQETDDDERAIGRLCTIVRERLAASFVGVFEAAAGAPVLASTNGRTGRAPQVVERALATGLLVPATTLECVIEAAAPVRTGNTTIAALACRWPVDALVEPGRAGALLSAGAAACAPAIRAIIDRRAQVAPITLTDPPILGDSAPMHVVRRAIVQASAAPFPVLIAGESGSGKELVARAVHRSSPRRDRRYCAVNCAAFADELLEAELFGHARGSFTGATNERPGLFEEAHGGTLFLDEVGELSARAQAKLLRVLQEGEIRRVGENHARHVDVRIVAATNRLLDEEVAAGRFRRDLLYRLDVVRIHVPALRERAEDIPALAVHFWQQAQARAGGRASLDRTALAALARYDWPGNVRELQNVMSALAVRAPRRGRVGPDQLPAIIAGAAASRAATLDEARRTFEQRFVRAALARAGGHQGRAAADLGVTRQGLSKLLRRLEIPMEKTPAECVDCTD